MRRFVIVLVLCVSSRALAQDAPQEQGDTTAIVAPPQQDMAYVQPYEPKLAVDLELAYFRSSGAVAPGTDANALSILLGASYQFTHELAVQLIWPFAFGDATNNAFGSHFGAFNSENPFLGVLWAPEVPHVRIRVGGGLTAPVGRDTVSGLVGVDAAVAFAAAVMHGMVDMWLWLPNTMSFVASGHVENERPFGGIIVLGADLATAVMIPFKDMPGGDAQFVLQAGFSAGFRIIPELTAGVRFWIVDQPTSAIFATTGGGGDPVQTSLTPYVRFEKDRWYADLSLTMNLDSPNGFAFDDGNFWGLRLAGGARF